MPVQTPETGEDLSRLSDSMVVLPVTKHWAALSDLADYATWESKAQCCGGWSSTTSDPPQGLRFAKDSWSSHPENWCEVHPSRNHHNHSSIWTWVTAEAGELKLVPHLSKAKAAAARADWPIMVEDLPQDQAEEAEESPENDHQQISIAPRPEQIH